MKKLDYTLTTSEERLNLVNEILRDNENISEKYLEILADYLIIASKREDRKKQKVLTENKMTTINKRETSFEGLVETFENGEDGVYNIMTHDKNIIFKHKMGITQKDIETIPFLAQLRESIAQMVDVQARAQGKDSYTAKKAVIDLRKDQYILKNAYLQPIASTKLTRAHNFQLFPDNIKIINGEITEKKSTLLDPDFIEFLLCHYSALKECAWSNFMGDLWYVMEDFDNLITKALQQCPVYESIVVLKIDGCQNKDIKTEIQTQYGTDYSLEYISSLWRNKIPKMIAKTAEYQYLEWYYTIVEKGNWKKCSRCGQVKLATNEFFSKNKTSKDGYYSICKECRNRRKK